jgi:molybdopterin synthase sulfur carrier subunit
MKIDLRYFASLREALGPGDSIELPAGAHAQALARGRALRCALDKRMVGDETEKLHDGAELAFFPPVTGG